MDMRRIGSLEISVVGLGCNNFGKRVDEAGTVRVVQAALDAGINFFDTADIYGGTDSERFLGRALEGRRDRAVIATKFGMRIDDDRQGARAEYVPRALEASLKRLGTDRIDLYQLHQPDPVVPIEETLGALETLVRAGKIREIGCSNFSALQLHEARAAATSMGITSFVSVQNEYSLLNREPDRDVLSECDRLGMSFLPYFPLASGLLTGKYRKGAAPPEGARLQAESSRLTDENLSIVEGLIDFANRRGHTILELAISWLLTRPTVASVIAGATSPDQVRANAAACRWYLASSDLSEIDRITARAR